eukprot:TRINITY_DN11114_c0_g1_i2.p1 TRINITY_DN11114_c0_g1~~TRINITY_DN11114_c0_g1_i2.p1  ORF type:complete len:226 (-),score=43.15 TRINITY_DN11114_c0_g1_i2:215-892(-)
MGMKSRIENDKASITNCKAKIEEINDKVKKLQKTDKGVSRILEEHKKDIEKLKDKLINDPEEITTKREIERLEKDYMNAKENINMLNRKLVQLDREIINETKRHTKLEIIQQESNNKLELVSNSSMQFQERLEKLTDEKSMLEREKEIIMQGKESIKGLYEEEANKIDKLKEKKERLSKLLNERNDQLKTKKQELANLVVKHTKLQANHKSVLTYINKDMNSFKQ